MPSCPESSSTQSSTADLRRGDGVGHAVVGIGGSHFAATHLVQGPSTRSILFLGRATVAGIESIASLDHLMAGLDLRIDPCHVLYGPAVGPNKIDPVASALLRARVGTVGNLQTSALTLLGSKYQLPSYRVG